MAMFSDLVDQTVKAVIKKTTFKEKENIKIPKNITPIPKLDKKDAVRNQRSQFSVKWYLIEYFMCKCKKSKKM